MKKFLLPLFVSIVAMPTFAQEESEARTLKLYDEVV